MKNTAQQNLLAALQGLVSDWERVHGVIPENHEAKAAIREAELANSREGKMNLETNIIEYHMVVEASAFNPSVAKKIREGFVPYGAPFSAPQEGYVWLCQAMVKYAAPTEKRG